MLFLGSNFLLLSLPLEPSVAQPISVNSIIQRNLYRHAKVELGLYLLLDSEPTETNDSLSSLSSSGHQSSSSTEDYWNDCSETSISFDEFIPAHLYTPRRLPIAQLIKNWWRYLRASEPICPIAQVCDIPYLKLTQFRQADEFATPPTVFRDLDHQAHSSLITILDITPQFLVLLQALGHKFDMFLKQLLVITFAITGPTFAIPMEQELARRAASQEANSGRFPANRGAPNDASRNEVHVHVEQPAGGTTENSVRLSNHPEPQNSVHSQTPATNEMVGTASTQAYQIHQATGVAQVQRENRRQVGRFFFAAAICLLFMGGRPVPSNVPDYAWDFVGAFFVYFAVVSSLGAANIR
ncbi:hypothetical protein PGT21_029557 [Puccinia graminis f. sp. tritici]|uniref:Uncharacterized protein n=1 Tax=Puccinia graminis f. sp. tritici TaxID=56615 RepID=A0A5B0QYT8_PUCGR|nr:hypothetical protein PGT21_029557 [Puccinia graminis f. sp. tritici]